MYLFQLKTFFYFIASIAILNFLLDFFQLQTLTTPATIVIGILFLIYIINYWIKNTTTTEKTNIYHIFKLTFVAMLFAIPIVYFIFQSIIKYQINFLDHPVLVKFLNITRRL